jgi:glycosyltransferase involved in cell wall biosynthesis
MKETVARRMAASGKRYTEENYNWDKIKSKYIKLVQDSINNTGFHSNK